MCKDCKVCGRCGREVVDREMSIVHTSQTLPQESHQLWCDSCKIFKSYICSSCNKRFSEGSGFVVTESNPEDGSQHYVCYECLAKEITQHKDWAFIHDYIKDIFLSDFDKERLRAKEFEYVVEFNQLLCLWTAYCLKYDLTPDTLNYDMQIMSIYNKLRHYFPDVFILPAEDQSEKPYFYWFDLWFGQHLA